VHWTDESIILSIRKHGENSAVARLFSHHHGVFAGVAKGVHSKTNRGVIQPGNVVSATWQARLPEHLGIFKAELTEPVAAFVMQDAVKLAALSSACTLIEAAMPERHPYPKLYKHLRIFLHLLKERDDWHEAYVRLEITLLAESGFGLDLSECAATGTKEDLIYVSPKSGRAVSREAGEPYKEKLLPLPQFLISSSTENINDISAALKLSGYFLDAWLLAPHGKKLPAARSRLVSLLKSHELEPAA
jgi:DNA repair protein RecO (recombination protein O)